ncbi:MAG: twin-arginine translocase subunit TatC [Crocinitomicaceae bacterium]|jgi:sec-independent protein translocase protein TatC|tara:strand:- start:10357 stop:11139 length:783 start_codon:yes stop_codon:yes gene_type:complete
MEPEKKMSFLDHLEELRWRIVKSAIVIVIFAVTLFSLQTWIMENLFLSMQKPSFITFRLMCQYFNICVESIAIDNQSIEMTGQFSYSLMMSIMGGFVLAFPFIFFQIWSFVKPGLKQNEKGIAGGIVIYVSILFFLGITFGYFIVAPLCVQFFGNYVISDVIKNNFTISSYLGLVLSTIFYTGLLFLLPVVSYLFTKLGVVSSDFLKKYRKHAIIGILILSALITPPDLISQVIVGIPIVLLYEVGIFVSKRVEKKSKNP